MASNKGCNEDCDRDTLLDEKIRLETRLVCREATDKIEKEFKECGKDVKG